MAQLDVQPKKKGPIWIWIIAILVIIGVIFMLMRGCNKSYRPTALKTTDSDSTLVDTGNKTEKTVATTQPDWEHVNFDLPKSNYDEITDTAIVVSGNTRYTVYGLGENILFGTGDSTLQSNADAKLKLVAASLMKRFKNAQIGVYGRTDSTGTATANKELGAMRADAVKDWLVAKGGFAEAMISVHSLGEAKPIATNRTAVGRQQNRSVEIVAFPKTSKNN